MAVHIRLSRAGAKKAPFYRIVVSDQRSPRDGRFIEKLGTFDPLRELVNLDHDRLSYWLSVGAQATHTLARLLKKHPAPAPATPAS